MIYGTNVASFGYLFLDDFIKYTLVHFNRGVIRREVGGGEV